MAFSASEGKEFFRDWLRHVAAPLQFKRFLDVGCGAGLYGDIIRDVFGKSAEIHAVEAFKEYVFRYKLPEKYDLVYNRDIRDLLPEIEDYDLITMGDVIEHLPRQHAIDVVKVLSKKCRFLWGALPVKMGRPWSTGYNQGPDEWVENPYNEHRHEWTGMELKEEFRPLWIVPFIMTGSFLVEGGIT